MSPRRFMQLSRFVGHSLGAVTLLAVVFSCRDDDPVLGTDPQPPSRQNPRAPAQSDDPAPVWAPTEGPSEDPGALHVPLQLIANKLRARDGAPAAFLVSSGNSSAVMRLVLDERNLPGTGAAPDDNSDESRLKRWTCFDDALRAALATPRTASLLASAGVDAKETADGILHVTFSRETALAFTRIACRSRQVVLNTKGNALMLVARDASRVRVDTTRENAPAGAFRLAISGGPDVWPEVEARGADGARGQDASCPAGFETCATPDAEPPRFPMGPAPEMVVDVKDTERLPSDPAVDGKTYADHLGFKITPREPPREAQCGHKATLVGQGPTRSLGTVKVRTTTHRPVGRDSVSLQGRAGLALPPGDGAPGHAGGNLEAISLGGHVASFEILDAAWRNAGGQGGAPGFGGLVVGAPGARSDTKGSLTVEEIAANSARMEGESTWTLLERHSVSGDSCHGSVTLSLRTVTKKSLFSPLAKTARVEARAPQAAPVQGLDGTTPKRPEGRVGASGHLGLRTFQVAHSFEEAHRALPEEAALPIGVAEDVERALRDGRLRTGGVAAK